MRRIYQREKVLELLRKGESVMSMDMWRLFGITRLSSIIAVLREAGYKISTEMIKVSAYTWVAEYSLASAASTDKQVRILSKDIVAVLVDEYVNQDMSLRDLYEAHPKLKQLDIQYCLKAAGVKLRPRGRQTKESTNVIS